MAEVNRKVKQVFTMIFGLLLAALGVFLLFQKDSFVRIFVSILGIYLIGSGSLTLFLLSTYKLSSSSKKLAIIKALVAIAVGSGAFLLPIFFAKLSWTILLYIVALNLLFNATVALNTFFKIRKIGVSFTSLVSDGLSSLILSVLLFAFPDQIGGVVLKSVGILLIFFGLGVFYFNRPRKKERERSASKLTIEAEAEVVD